MGLRILDRIADQDVNWKEYWEISENCYANEYEYFHR